MGEVAHGALSLCHGGVHRSYLIATRGWTTRVAFDFVKEKRHIATIDALCGVRRWARTHSRAGRGGELTHRTATGGDGGDYPSLAVL